MGKKILVFGLCFLFLINVTEPLCAREPRPARPRNLCRLVENNRILKVYLGDIVSEAPEIKAEEFKGALKNYLLGRFEENFIISDTKKGSEVTINAKVLSYQYLEKDPVDNVIGGISALLVDAAVDQNYAKIDAEFIVLRAKDDKKLWGREFESSVTESFMPPPDSIPKVIHACLKQFVFLCFGKSKE